MIVLARDAYRGIAIRVTRVDVRVGVEKCFQTGGVTVIRRRNACTGDAAAP